MSKRFLRRREVTAKTALPTSTIYERMSAGMFPKPVHLSPRIVVWLEEEIDAWMDAQIVAEREGEEAA